MMVVSADLSPPTVIEAFGFLIRLVDNLESRSRLLEKLHTHRPQPHDRLVTI